MRLYLPSSRIEDVPRLLSRSHLLQQGRHGLSIVINLSLHSRLQRRIRYSNQPQVQMWDHWLPFLLWHIDAVAVEIEQRGCVSRTLHERLKRCTSEMDLIRSRPVEVPTWIGYDRLFETHRAMLLHVQRNWYSQHDWIEPASSVPLWPALLPEVGETLMDPDGELWTVGEVNGYQIQCVRSDEVSTIVPTEAVYTRRWQRVIED